MSAGNSTLADILAEVRDLLNEPTASNSFWADSQLKRYIKNSHRDYWRKWARKKPEFGSRQKDFTYTASAEYVDVSFTDDEGFPATVDYCEDRTDMQPGTKIPWADSMEALTHYYNQLGDTVLLSNWPARIFGTIHQSASSGVQTNVFRTHVAPIPSGSRSMRLHYQAEPYQLTALTHTTGLPDVVEQCIILKAASIARAQEEATDEPFRLLLDEAEKEMISSSRPLRKGPKRVRSTSSW
ncbi:MAG: hypothetical protein JRF33_25280 [Deltaproteobacteria bacterium]|nr:hypothetical protein [Deltaproteobacteria bacterium]